jgi:hypothetical protein
MVVAPQKKMYMKVKFKQTLDVKTIECQINLTIRCVAHIIILLTTILLKHHNII